MVEKANELLVCKRDQIVALFEVYCYYHVLEWWGHQVTRSYNR